MKILVLGGSYFAGRYFVEMARRQHEVTVFNRGNVALDLENVQEIVGDRHDDEALKQLANREFQVVVDFCGYEKQDIERVIAVIGDKLQQYIFVSTVDVLERGLQRVLDEEAPYETRDFGGQEGSYILGKVALEQELKSLAQQREFAYTIVRPAFIYGPGNYAPREGIYFHWIAQAGQILHPVDATGVFYLVFVEDVAKATLSAAGNQEAYNQIFHLVGEKEVTYDSFAKALRQSVEREIQQVDISVDFVREKGIPLPFPLTKEESNWYDGRKARILISQYESLNDGMRKTAKSHLQD